MTCYRRTFRGSLRASLIVLTFFGLAISGQPVNATVLHDDRGEASVVETVRSVRISVSYLASSSDPMIAVVIGTTENPRHDLSLEEAAAVLDRALGEFDHDHRLPARMDFQPASLRDPLLALLRTRLAKPGANWNPKTGTARSGDVYRTLAQDMLAITAASPLATAFAHHGYRLISSGHVHHVEVDKVSGFGVAKMPIEIQEMGLIAVRTQ